MTTKLDDILVQTTSITVTGINSLDSKLLIPIVTNTESCKMIFYWNGPSSSFSIFSPRQKISDIPCQTQ